jgi:hypothetical protein
VDWEAAGGGGGGAAGAAAAQQLLAGRDWRGAQQRQARIATGGRWAGWGLLRAGTLVGAQACGWREAGAGAQRKSPVAYGISAPSWIVHCFLLLSVFNLNDQL